MQTVKVGHAGFELMPTFPLHSVEKLDNALVSQ
jgi:hypothetical protein